VYLDLEVVDWRIRREMELATNETDMYNPELLGLQNVAHSSIRMMVIANLMISPIEAYVLKYATVKYKVEQIRQNSVVGKLHCLKYLYKWEINKLHSSPLGMDIVEITGQKKGLDFVLLLENQNRSFSGH